MSQSVNHIAHLCFMNGEYIITSSVSDFNMFVFSISFYKEMCEKLTKERDQLEEDKRRIKQDLNKLQTEIKGNAHSVKTLEDKMERLQKEKLKISQKLVSPEEMKSVTLEVKVNSAWGRGIEGVMLSLTLLK